MELAGLSCAHAIAKEFKLDEGQDNKILVIAGPGNNGSFFHFVLNLHWIS